MPAERLTMRKIRELLRLKFDFKLSNRKIANSCSMVHSTVGDYVRRFKSSGLRWPLPDDLDDRTLEQLLFKQPQIAPADKRPLPDWTYIHKELRRKAVTLMLLWQEYKEQYPDGLQYSQFCQRYRDWTQTIDPVMRLEHRAGQAMFVDYAGMSVPVIELLTNAERPAQIFVSVLGASSYTFAEATWTQGLADWIGSHIRCFEFFEGVPLTVVPDNLKSGVTKACYYEPDINPTYLDLANHYATVILPTRVRKPRDKAKVESAVQTVERWILARLRNRKFFGLHQLNAAIAQLLEELNNKAFQKLAGSRRLMYESIDRPALKPLPAQRYEYAEWKTAMVNIDYHIEVDHHYYSVPHQLLKKKVDVRITENIIECFHQHKSVAVHRRSYRKGGYTTVKEHMPKAHQQWVDWNPQRFIRWASKIGPDTAKLIENVIDARPVPQQAYRSCLGILRLAKSYGDQRLEAASKRALTIGATSYKSLASILKNKLDCRVSVQTTECPGIDHDNIRGSRYYH